MKKSERQAIIADIIKQNNIGTQNELLELLCAKGVEATQATISRDIKEMRVVKQNTPSGDYVYSVPGVREGSAGASKSMALLLGAVEKTDIAMNTIVVKCHPGAAQAAAAALDKTELTGVAGTIAGDDTIFILCYSEAQAAAAKAKLDELFGF